MLITKKVIIKVAKGNLKHYLNLGYNCKVGDQFEVNVDHLPRHSKIKVDYQCDYCGEICQRDYGNHIMQTERDIIKKDSCKRCKSIKTKESNLIIYGVESVMHVNDIKEKVKNTVLDRYGVESVLSIKEVREKAKNTMIERYGTSNMMEVEEIKEKMKSTSLKKYGVEWYTQTDEYKIKHKITSLKKYGTENPFQNKDVQEKQKQTCLKRYGVENVFQNENVKSKIKETIIDKYGVEHPMLNSEIKNRAIENQRKTLYLNQTAPTSKQQLYLHKLLGGELNYPVSKLSLDIAFPEEKIYIEYDGGGHDLSVKLNHITYEELQRKELNRYFFLKSHGWKQIKIISPNDLLPSDETLLFEIKKAKKWFNNDGYGHSHYIINIDNFNKNHLRKII